VCWIAHPPQPPPGSFAWEAAIAKHAARAPGHREPLPALRGTAAQVEWAEELRPAMLSRLWSADNLNVLAAIKSINDASWFIANRGVVSIEDLKLPTQWFEVEPAAETSPDELFPLFRSIEPLKL
jgi:hypothetical protein